MQLANAQYAARDYQGVVWTLAPWMETGQASPDVEEAEVWFLAGRSFSRLDSPEAAEDALRRAVDAGFGNESAFASYLLADLLQDDGRVAEARAAYERTITRFPRSGWAARSLIRLGMLAYLESDYAQARRTFDRYRRRYPGGAWYHATVYWTARSVEAAGDSAAARALYREAVGISPLSYYGQLGARRLGLDPFALATREGGPLEPLSAEKQRLLERLRRLRSLGWSGRAERELAAAMRSGGIPRSQLLPFAVALSEAGWARQGIRLGLRAHRGEGAKWTEAALRAVHPLPYRSAIEELARRHGLDAALVAGLIRRESLFEAEVVSSAGAVGLMQVLPRTALEMADDAGLETFDSAQLGVPEANLRLGTAYLARMLSRFDGSTPAALISYNAGPHRYLQWRHFPERAVDEELFVERIPFLETRVYAKEVTSNALIYGRLYRLQGPTVDGAERGR
jgi:soluble lytic murein transglycosylase